MPSSRPRSQGELPDLPATERLLHRAVHIDGVLGGVVARLTVAQDEDRGKDENENP